MILFPEILSKQYFQNPETKEFWFHATGACNSLGYKNVSSALALHCDDDEKLMEIVDGKATWFVSEAGFYGLAMGAKTDKAKKFKRWMKHDILPKLRTEGYYIARTDSETLEKVQLEVTELQAKNALLQASNSAYNKKFLEILKAKDKNNNFDFTVLSKNLERIGIAMSPKRRLHIQFTLMVVQDYKRLHGADYKNQYRIFRSSSDYERISSSQKLKYITFKLEKLSDDELIFAIAEGINTPSLGGSGESKNFLKLMTVG